MEQLNGIVLANPGIVVIVVAVVATAALLIAVSSVARSGAVAKRFAWIEEHSGEGPDTLATLVKAVQDNKLSILRLESQVTDAIAESRTHFKRVGLVRYDAFDGVAGQQSYSLCLLDDGQNGVILSSLVGSNFNRGYALEIRSGEAYRKLGDEESESLAAAIADTRAA